MLKSGIYYLAALIAILAPSLARADNGMDMSMDGAMALTMSSMRAYLHFTPGDTLWFMGWVPLTGGATFGACIGLFLLSLVDRWLAAMRATAERAWQIRAQAIVLNQKNGINAAKKDQDDTIVQPQFRNVVLLRAIPPFIPAHDIARGVLHAAQAALTFAFMLAVMTFNAAFIISIVIGMGVGETLFGRYIGAANGH